jgi:hypothetical protein
MFLRKYHVLATALLAISGCTQSPEPPAAKPRPALAERGVPAPPPTALPAPPRGGRQSSDLAPCPGINPDIRRPAGSNCLGIVPQACAADKVSDILKKTDSAALRADVTRRTGNTNVRWIGDGEAVIENLDPTRLNIQLDAQRRVHNVDCY